MADLTIGSGSTASSPPSLPLPPRAPQQFVTAKAIDGTPVRIGYRGAKPSPQELRDVLSQYHAQTAGSSTARR
jgi:hypothetical protein